MNDAGRSYWDKHAKNYERSMSLLGRPMPRMVELAGEATRGLERVLEVAAGTGLVTRGLAASAREVVATTTRQRWSRRSNSGCAMPG